MSNVDEATPRTGNPLAVEVGRRPKLSFVIAWFVVHVTVWIGLVKVVPGGDAVGYSELGAVSTPWVRQFVVALLVVFVLQAVALTRLGLWGAVMRDPTRSTRRLMWLPTVVIVLAAVGVLADSGFAAEAGGEYLLGCAVTVLLVGVTEEITFRGVIHVEGRRLFSREWQALLLASALFGLFHLPNIVLGAEVNDALRQTVATAVIGAGIYSLRRVSGSLLPCILLHAAYDFVLIQSNWDVIVG